MCAAIANVRSRFVDHVFHLLERVECRRVETAADQEAAYKLRYDAYRRENWIEASKTEKLFDDHYDRSPNGRVFGVFIDGECWAVYAYRPALRMKKHRILSRSGPHAQSFSSEEIRFACAKRRGQRPRTWGFVVEE